MHLELSKVSNILGILATVFGTLNSADILALVPHNVATIIILGGAITSALSKALFAKPQA